MRKLRNVFSVIWQGIFALNFVLTLLFFYPFLVWCFAKKSRRPIAMKIQRIWAKWLLVTMGIPLEIRFEEPLDKNRTYIFTPNHNNFLDILVGYFVVPGYFHYMAKASLAKAPLFGILFKNTHIPFNRSSNVEANSAFQRAAADLREGISIVIFPEGTQNTRKGNLLPFKNGAFKMSVAEGIPIVPVSFQNNLDILPHAKDLFSLRVSSGPKKAVIVVGKPIFPEECENDALLLKEKVFTIVQNNLKRG